MTHRAETIDFNDYMREEPPLPNEAPPEPERDNFTSTPRMTTGLPANMESETSLLAACVNFTDGPACARQIAEALGPEDFYRGKHQQIIAVIHHLLGEGVEPTLAAMLARLNELGATEIKTYLGKLMDSCPASVDIPYHIGNVRAAAIKRRAKAAASKLLHEVDDLSLEEIETRFRSAHHTVCTEIEISNLEGSHWNDPVDLSKLIDIQPAPISWFADERLPMGRGCLINGIGGSSKTQLLYQLAVGAIRNRLAWDWTINAENTGRALLVLTEDTAEEVHQTIHNVCDGLGLSYSDRVEVYNNLIPYPMAGKDCILLEKTSTGAMVETALFRSLERKIKSYGDVKLVGIDPALSVTTGDELSQGDQRALGRTIDNLAVRTGAIVILVAHATKASINKDELDSHNSRGGGAITDAVRAEYAMRTMTAKEAKMAGIEDIEERKRHVQLVATKGNRLPPSAFVPVWLRRDQTGTLSQVDLVFGAETQGPGKKDLMALDVLKEISATATPTLKDWREVCIEREIVTGKTPDAQSKAMQRIVKKLAGAELIKPGIGKGIWMPGGEE